MDHIVLRHLIGSREKKEDIFKPGSFKEITLGRDLTSSVRFGEDEEFMVSRHHARIIQNPALPAFYLITDLNSINGTFVNDQRINGTFGLKKGDVVRLGVGGPVFQFDIVDESDLIVNNQAPAVTVNLKGVPPPQLAQPVMQPATADVAEQISKAEAVGAASNTPYPNRSLRKLLIVCSVVLIGLIALGAGLLSYGYFRSVTTTGPDGVQPGNSLVSPSGIVKAEVEKDAQRAAWRLDIKPYLVLGSGHPGKLASDFNKPDGVAFSAKGLLFATDAGNRRVQIWDVRNGKRLAEFGHKVFEGEIVDIAVQPDNMVLITDKILNFVYAFMPPQAGALDDKGRPLGPYDYQFKGLRFGEQAIVKLGGIASDSKGRVYAVDSHINDVIRFNSDGKVDKTWKFGKTKADGDTYLHGSEGIAIDEANRNLFIASEKDSVIELFDWETGAYKNRFVGAAKDSSGKPTGKYVFFGTVKGLAITRNHLLAVDESAGHIQIFDLSKPDAFNTDLAGYDPPQFSRTIGYKGFFGHAPLVDFEDQTNLELQTQVKNGSIIPGKANPPGYFCSPDSIASYTDTSTGESFIAIADQFNYRIVIYRWSDISKAMGAVPAMAMNAPKPKNRPVRTPVVKRKKPPVTKTMAPSHRVVRRPAVSKPASETQISTQVKPNPVVGNDKEHLKNQSESEIPAKKGKKTKKDKKIKYQ
jgi:WD40 repeat protein